MNRLQSLISWCCFLFLVMGLYLQHNVGLADNGDFSRAMTLFTSGPVGIEPNWPDPDLQPEAWHNRFFTYWLPAWKLDSPGRALFYSTSLLLWVPGVLLNYLFVSRRTLYLQSLGLVVHHKSYDG